VAARPVVRSDPLPVWQQVQKDLTRRVRKGEFGDRFPSELALAGEYAVSRHTVRQALRSLRDGGFVTASRGRPSQVAEPGVLEQPLGALYGLLAAAEAAGLRVHSRVRILAIRADAMIAHRLRLDDAAPLVLLDRLRYAGEQPLALDRIWMPAALARPLLDVDFRTARWYVELGRRAGIWLDSGEEQIYAVVPDKTQRRLLHLPDGAAAFAIRQLGHAHGAPLVCRQVLVRADRFGLHAEFDGRHGYRLLAAQRAGWERR
jgi:GntR family transcriptional regulator